MRADLTFEDEMLEQEFGKLQAGRSRQLGKQFHFNRAGVWGVVLLRVLLGREWGISAAVTIVLLLPALVHCLPLRLYTRWRLPLKVFDNLLQLSLGCYMHHYIYPNPKNGPPSAFQMAAVLLTGNGVPWQLFNSIWESLPFRYALPQQAALTILLLMYNRNLCQRNVALRYSYVALQTQFLRRTRLLLPRLWTLRLGLTWWGAYRAGRGCAAAVLAAPVQAREAVRSACMVAQEAAVQEAAAAQALLDAAQPMSAAAAAARMATDGVDLCVRYQPLSQLLLGFVFPTFYIWSNELRMRRAFLHQHSSSSSLQDRRAAVAREREPGMVEYFMFAVPAVACMWSVVAVHA